MKMLVIDDDQGIREALTVSFTTEWETCEVIAAEEGTTGLRAFEEHQPEIVILDIGLPGLNGLEVLERIRQQSNAPVVMLSARDGEEDIVRALEIGADDYVTKPFRYLELMARIKAVQRRASERGPNLSDDLEVDGLVIRFRSQEVFIDGLPVALTNTEYRLLYHLARNRGRVLSHRELLRLAWGSESYGTDVVRVYVSRLRSKVEQDPDRVRFIHTKPGVGYLFAPESDAGKPELPPVTLDPDELTDGDLLAGNRSRRWRWSSVLEPVGIRATSPVS
jgi:two-component system, OmpR family, KDP operon response regulator KdpE